jgi:predicted RNA-binding protein with RPS1 domain
MGYSGYSGDEVGSKVSGRIVNIEDYGAFLEVHSGRRRSDTRI